MVSNNLFAYCDNDPVNKVDPSGEFVLTWLTCAVIVAACATMIAIVNTPSFQKSWNDMCDGIARGFSKAFSWASAKAKSIAQSIGDSFAKVKTKPKYRSKTEVHHVVAKAASNAARARQVLNAVGIDVNSSENLIRIKTGLHRRLHTKKYYDWANSVVVSAYNKGKNKSAKRKNVKAALKNIKSMINKMNAKAPF